MDTIICQHCGFKNEKTAGDCQSCKSPLGFLCDSCGKLNSFLLNYCDRCGTPFKKNPLQSEWSRDAERRHLNVMFCDLVGSTVLSETLDPEELRDIVVAYQEVCALAIEEQEGYIAQYLGDGILVYFGYPKSHEDESLRAVKAALKIMEDIKKLNEDFAKTAKPGIAVRIGIHSGLTVIGDIGRGTRRERLALGETPNIAARIQSLAEPGTVLISGETFKIIQKHFYCHNRGTHLLKGISIPVTVYQPVLSEQRGVSGAQDFNTARRLIGREEFSQQLFSAWQKVKDGHAEVVLIKGEAGIGKTHLINDFVSAIPDSEARKIVFRCASYGQNNAFVPFINILSGLTGINGLEVPEKKLPAIEAFLSSLEIEPQESIPLFASLLSIPLPENYQPLSSSFRLIQEKTFLLIKRVLTALSAEKPVLFILEDLQWADPSTQGVMKQLMETRTNERILYLLSSRAEFSFGDKVSFTHTEIVLPNLDEEQTKELAEHIAGDKRLPPPLIEAVVKRTDGIPLFIEELLYLILESNVLEEHDDSFELKGSLPELSIPSTLQDLLIAKLDQLGKARDIAQLGAVFGRDFTSDVMESISSLNFDTLSTHLKTLVDEMLLIIKGEAPYLIFSFRHALVQEKAYQLLLKSKRQQYHLVIAEALEKDFPQFVKASPEFIAHHYTMAGKHLPAIQYWQKAGAMALSKSAYQEAIIFFNKGMSMLPQVTDEEERYMQELYLLSGLAPALLTTKGYTDKSVEAAYSRAHELMDRMKDLPQLSSLLRGLWSHYTVRSNHRAAFHIARKLDRISKQTDDVLIEFEACKVMGGNFFWRGEFLDAQKRLEATLKKFDPEIYYRHLFLYSEHPVVSSLTYRSLTLWMLGRTREAVTSSQLAIDYATKLNHPFTIVYATGFASVLYQFMRDIERTAHYSKETVALGTRYGFAFWQGMGNILYNWTRMEKNAGEGLEKMELAVQTLRGSGVELWISNPLAILAEAYGEINQPKKGMHLIDEAFRLLEKSDEKFYLAELHRIRGVLHLKNGDDPQEAEKSFMKASGIAEKQQAKNFALRASLHLALLRHEQGDLQKAQKLIRYQVSELEKDGDSEDLRMAQDTLEKISLRLQE